MPKRRPRRFARLPALVAHDVPLGAIDPRHDGIRIAHLTDIHCGAMTPREHVRAAVDLVNAARPDLVVMTGDYVCWHPREVRVMEEQLAGIDAPAVLVTLGNHDYYASGLGVAAAMIQNGYTVLRNEHRTLELAGAPLHVIGIDDPVTRRHDLDRAFAGVPAGDGGTRLVLCHCPEQVDRIAARGAHLVLSGHTHGGQINLRGITDRVLRRMGRRYKKGFYSVGDSMLYVSAGVGFSGVRIRLGHGTRAEVSLLTLRRAASAAA